MKMKWKKQVVIGGASVLFLCAVILPKVLNRKPFAEGASEPIVEVTEPSRHDIRLTTGLVGEAEPEDVVYLYPKAAGDVTGVYVKAGEVVSEGQILCEIDTKQVESAKSAFDSAELSLRQAKEELTRQSVLYSGGGISEQAYQQYQDQVTAAEIAYENAKINYENQVSYSRIAAPISGLVEVCGITTHDTVNQSTLLCVISGEGNRVVSFAVSERIRKFLSEGDEIQIEKNGELVSGTIYEVSTMADASSGLFKVKASVEAEAGEEPIPTGSAVKLYVTSEYTENALCVPVDSVYYDGGQAYVYLYEAESSTLEKLAVETGLYDEEWIEVTKGLNGEETVLTTWTSELSTGTKVRLKETSFEAEYFSEKDSLENSDKAGSASASQL